MKAKRNTYREAYPERGAIKHALGEHDEMVCACDVDIEEEADEMSVVEMTDAVVHPRAMMVCTVR